MKKSILSPDKNYTFSDFFELPYPTEDVVKEFGYSFSFELLDLPRTAIEDSSIKELQHDLTRKLPKISLTSEIAQRDFLIAPVLLELMNFVDIKIAAEYPIESGKNLRGILDYLIRSEKNLTVIEAKKGDFEKGFTQLAVELIAMEQYEEEQQVLFGAVTTGDLWKFGKLESVNKKITKDINIYRVPADLTELFSILTGILQ